MSSRPTPAVGLVATALILAGLAGCLGDDQTPPPTSQPAATGNATPTEPPARAVVADIGPGTNPYHEAFRRPNWTTHPCHRVPGLPCSIPTLNLTFAGNYTENVQADREAWADYEEGQVYWVEQTNLLLVTTQLVDQQPGRAQTEGGGVHGVATSGAVNDACPDCYVMAVQDGRSLDGDPVRHLARNLSYVDVVTSTNWPGTPSRTPFGGNESYANATYELWATGRPFVAGSGNQGLTGLALASHSTNKFPWAQVQLPPWVVLAGGAHPECEASSGPAGKPAEVVGDYRQRLPLVQSVDRRVNVSGTSFAAPQVAGEIGELIGGLRERLGVEESTTGSVYKGENVESPVLSDGKLTLPELRTVLHHSAAYFTTTDYDQGCGAYSVGTDPSPEAGGTPVSPEPYVQMGWGYLGDEARRTARDVILGEAELPDKSEAAQTYMDLVRQTREQLYPWPNGSK